VGPDGRVRTPSSNRVIHDIDLAVDRLVGAYRERLAERLDPDQFAGRSVTSSHPPGQRKPKFLTDLRGADLMAARRDGS
jgi:hypothetical protein